TTVACQMKRCHSVKRFDRVQHYVIEVHNVARLGTRTESTESGCAYERPSDDFGKGRARIAERRHSVHRGSTRKTWKGSGSSEGRECELGEDVGSVPGYAWGTCRSAEGCA